MKKLNRLTLSAVMAFIFGTCFAQDHRVYHDIQYSFSQADTVKVMTFNIRANNILEGFNKWGLRKQVIFDILADNDADVIGLQEARYPQLVDLRQALRHYDYYAAGRSDGLRSGESCPIFYRKDRFTLLDSGTFWFSNTPSVSGTKDWGNIVPRICSWVYLLDRGRNTRFYVYNLHLDAFSGNSREKSVRLLARQIAKRKTRDAFIVTGDFNMELHNPAMKYLMKFGYDTPYPKMVDAWLSVHGRSGASTCRAVGGLLSGPHIDHIQMGEQAKALDVVIDSRRLEGNYASDHFPVVANILIPSSAQIAQLQEKDLLASITLE